MQRIAILPIKNKIGPDWDFLARGLTDQAQKALVAAKNVVVISRESVDLLTMASGDYSLVFKQLNIALLLVGKLSQKHDILQLDLRCFENDDEMPMWQHRLKAELSAPKELSDLLVSLLNSNLTLQHYPPTTAASQKSAPLNQDAYRAYLLGNHYLQRWEHGYAELALEQFEHVATLEPDFVPARLGIARAIIFLVGRGFRRAEIEYPRTLTMLDRMTRLSPAYGELYISRGIIEFFYLLDWASAYRNIERGLRHLSEASEAYAQLSLFWYGMREYDQSLEALQVAAEYNPLSVSLLQMRGDVLLSAERYPESAAVFRTILDLQPGDKPALENLMYLAALQKNERLTRKYLRRLLVGTDAETVVTTYPRLGYVYAWLGMERETQLALSRLLKLTETDPDKVQFGRLANIYAGLGDQEKTMEYAEKAFAHRTGILFVLTDPLFGFIRQLPRYRALEKQIKLPVRPDNGQRIIIRSALKATLTITPDNLLYAQAEENYVRIVLYNNFRLEEKLLRMTMTSLLTQLPDHHFWRCHKSWVVNTHLQFTVAGNSRATTLWSDRWGFTVPVGRKSVGEISSRLSEKI